MEQPTLKKCTKCGECKPATLEFFRRKVGGLEAGCKPCMQAYSRTQHEKHKARRNADRRNLPDELRKQQNAINRSNYAAKREEFLTKRRAYTEANREKIKLTQIAYRAAKQELISERTRRYKLANKVKVKKWKGDWLKRKIKADPVAHTKRRIRALINIKLIQRGFKKRSSTHEILGCDWPTFAKHLERQFLKGMSWENRDQWHIDHIVPLSTAQTEEDVIRLNHYTNLRPLWAKDNLAKSDKVLYLI